MYEEEENLFFEEFFMKSGHYRSVVEYLSKKYATFSDYINKAKQIQEIKLCKLGLSSKSNPAITIFLLKNNHGYSDQKKMDLTTDGKSIEKQIYRLGDGTAPGLAGGSRVRY
jgi:hypothetical protein